MSYSEGKGVGPGLAGVMLRLHFEANSKTMSGIGSACVLVHGWFLLDRLMPKSLALHSPSPPNLETRSSISVRGKEREGEGREHGEHLAGSGS